MTRQPSICPYEAYWTHTTHSIAIVVFHNHPSGDPTPSPEDVALTRRIVAAGVLMGIAVVDHLVLGDMRYYSFKESRQL